MKRKKLLFIFSAIMLLLIFVIIDVDVSINNGKSKDNHNSLVENKLDENIINSDNKDEGIEKKVPVDLVIEASKDNFNETLNKPYEILDRSLIRQKNSNDVYIVKLVGEKKFRRIILNPAIFDSYEDLIWEDIVDVSLETLFSYKESNLVMEVDSDDNPIDGSVYKVEPYNDTGVKYLLGIERDEFESFGYDLDSVYLINHIEASDDFYVSEDEVVSTEISRACTQDWLEVTKDILDKVNVPDDLCIEVVSQDSAVGKFILNQGINGFYVIEDNVVAVIGDIGLITLHAEIHEVCHAQQDWYSTQYYGVDDSLDGWIDTEMGKEFINVINISNVETEETHSWFLPGDSLLVGMYDDNSPIELAAEVCSIALLVEEGIYENKYGYSKEYMEQLLSIGDDVNLREWYNKWISA